MEETIAMAPVVPPTSLPDRYEMIAELGRGGMGIVYQVRDRETGEIVALKFLKSEIAADPQILERFKNELRLAHKITHRNVARLYEFHRWAESVYVSMEYVEGESFARCCGEAGNWTPSAASKSHASSWRGWPKRIDSRSSIAI